MDDKTAVTYPIAKDEDDRWVEISAAKAGGKYSCPECHSRFVPRLGEIRVHHFAHYPGYTGVCTGESGYHSLAKQLLAYYFDKNRQVKFSWKCQTCGRQLSHVEEVEHVDVEKIITDGGRPDLTVSFQSGRQLYGEVVFRNPLEIERVGNYKTENISLLTWKIDGPVERVPEIEFVPWREAEGQLGKIRTLPGCNVCFGEEQFQVSCDHKKTPQELGLPKKFQCWWKDQYETIEAIVNSPKPVYLLDVPTGVGKTVIAVGVHRLSEKKCIFITRTKQLQSQVEEDFPGIVKVVRGRENYPCLKHPDDFHPGDSSSYTAANCTDSKNRHCEFKDKCLYLLAKEEALVSPLAVLNASYYLTEINGINGPGKFSGVELLVVDEVDSLEDELMNYIQFSVSEKQLGRLGIPLPHNPDELQAWLAWAEMIGREIGDRRRQLQGQLVLIPEDKWQAPQLAKQKEADRLESFGRRVAFFVREFDDTWVFYSQRDEETGERKWVFKPIFISKYASRFLWRHADRVLGMSATIFDPYIAKAALELGEGHYKRLSSPFPVKHRPIFYSPAANLTKGTMDTERPKLLSAVQVLINRYPNDKILIHTVSYLLRDFLVKNLEQGRLITHTKWNREDKLEEFKNSHEPLVMLSPSFDRGVDLPQEKCRYIIICKVPYLYKGDPQIRGRMKAPGGQKWYLLKAAQTLVQMSGRAVRSVDDYCDTYILDRQFDRLFSQMKHMKIATGDPILPQWWIDAVRIKIKG